MSHILITEDEPFINMVLTAAFEEAGYAVCSTFNAREALEHLNAHASETDLIITDNRMPGMSGEELLALVKSQHPRVKRVMVSGTAAPENVADITHAFIAKPADPAQVVRTASELLKLKAA